MAEEIEDTVGNWMDEKIHVCRSACKLWGCPYNTSKEMQAHLEFPESLSKRLLRLLTDECRFSSVIERRLLLAVQNRTSVERSKSEQKSEALTGYMN